LGQAHPIFILLSEYPSKKTKISFFPPVLVL
jgi:hypothetical protein